jgi:hypothetical protein
MGGELGRTPPDSRRRLVTFQFAGQFDIPLTAEAQFSINLSTAA